MGDARPSVQDTFAPDGALAADGHAPGDARMPRRGVGEDINGYQAHFDTPLSGANALPTRCDVRLDGNNLRLLNQSAAGTVFCVPRGNHEGWGRLTITSAGTATNKNWLIYDVADPADAGHLTLPSFTLPHRG